MTDSERILTELEDWKRCGYAEMFPFYYPILDDVIELLKSQPQIVRCKDCKYFSSPNDFFFCKLHFGPKPNWFCADGEEDK